MSNMPGRVNTMRESSFVERYGPWAFVAGASMGIGPALAVDAARRGLNVVLLARGEERLLETAAAVSRRHGVKTRTVVADLASPEIGRTVSDATDDLEIGLVVYNAAVGPAGRFVDTRLDLHLLSIFNFGTYNAGKAFEWILAETLWAELGDRGVDVTTILVGARVPEVLLHVTRRRRRRVAATAGDIDPNPGTTSALTTTR